MSEATRPKVLFVSKPMSPPFRDGSKCLVRDLCLHLDHIDAHVMSTTMGADELLDRATLHRVYRTSGRFTPGLLQNLQAFSWLAISPKVDIWHSIFAPNPRSSRALSVLARSRRVRVCQTIASPPRRFEPPEQLLFGDIVVAQSAWTKRKFVQAYDEASLSVPTIVEIPPPCPAVPDVGSDRISAVRSELNLEQGAPLFVYPGDLEISTGPGWLIEWAGLLHERFPKAKILFAFRNKTSRSREMARQLQSRSDPRFIIFREDVPDILGVLASSAAILFPVDDLYGKVDLPIVLLEALSLGVPVLSLNRGPLTSLHGAELLERDPRLWLDCLDAIINGAGRRNELSLRGQQAVSTHFNAGVIARAYAEVYRQLMD